VAVVGEGRIDGQGAVWWEKWRATTRTTGVRPGANRPRLVYIVRSHNVLFEGVSFYNSPSYHLVFKDCANVTVDHIKITALAHSPNTDAIDPIDTRDMVITNNTIDCGDDVVALKSARVDPLHPGAAVGNITIAHNTILKGRGISIGSETIGGVHHVLVEDNTTYDAMYGIRIKTPRKRGGDVSDIVFRNNRMIGVETPIVFSTYYETLPVNEAEVQRRIADGGFVLNDQIYPGDRDPAQPYVANQTPDVHDITRRRPHRDRRGSRWTDRGPARAPDSRAHSQERRRAGCRTPARPPRRGARRGRETPDFQGPAVDAGKRREDQRARYCTLSRRSTRH
jgi:polygalacturonase